MELQDLPPSMSPLAVWSNLNGGKPVPGDSVVLNIGTSDASSNEEDEFEEEGRNRRNLNGGRPRPPDLSSPSSSSSCPRSRPSFCPAADLYPREEDEDDELQFRGHQGDWEVQMLARELERREEQNRLQEEVRVLEQAVNDNTCTLDDLSNSQLDLLERMLTSGTALRRATAPAHYPPLPLAGHTHSPHSIGAAAGLARLRRGCSLEEGEAGTLPPALPSTSASALYRRRSFRKLRET